MKHVKKPPDSPFRDRMIRLAVLTVLLFSGGLCTLLLSCGRAPSLLRFLQSGTSPLPEKPAFFGTFHLISLALCLLVTVCGGIGAAFLTTRVTDPDRKNRIIDRVVFICGAVFLILEWYKQLFSYFVTGNGYYDYAVFPFQFCSLPLYLCLFAPLLPPSRLRHALLAFLSLFGTVGGYLVMGYPAFPAEGILCIHMMLWHSLMIALGVFLLIADGIGTSLRKDYLPASVVFLTATATATILNIALHPFTAHSKGPLNLFYMSPFYQTYFVLISDIQKVCGWFPALLAYIGLFLILGALPLWFLGRLCRFARMRHRPRHRDFMKRHTKDGRSSLSEVATPDKEHPCDHPESDSKP